MEHFEKFNKESLSPEKKDTERLKTFKANMRESNIHPFSHIEDMKLLKKRVFNATYSIS